MAEMLGRCFPCCLPKRESKQEQVRAPHQAQAQNLAKPNGSSSPAPAIPALNTSAAVAVVEKDFAAEAAAEQNAANKAKNVKPPAHPAGGDVAPLAESPRTGAGKSVKAAIGVVGSDQKKASRPGSEAEDHAQGNGSTGGSGNLVFEPRSTPRSIFAHPANGEQQDASASRPPHMDSHDNASAGEILVKDADGRCQPGVKVVVAQKWLSVSYFQQFKGLVGELTRRGVSGVTWYAAFPGLPEQAFSTGMHGQHVLAYAENEARHAASQAAPPRKVWKWQLDVLQCTHVLVHSTFLLGSTSNMQFFPTAGSW